MEFMALLVIVGLLGIVFGWVAYFRTGSLQKEIAALRNELVTLRKELAGPRPQQDNSAVAVVRTTRHEADETAPAAAIEVPNKAPTLSARDVAPSAVELNKQDISGANLALARTELAWLQHLKQHWMVWLGGACVGLAGIFLVKYSMDKGLLGPLGRVISGLISGLILHGTAEWLRRHQPFHPSFAALAGGGSLTLFAALLAALHLYALISPLIAFTGMALVALLTMGLALKQGPVLAILGLLGAYLVPLLVGGGADSEQIVLVYALIISAAALLLMRYIFRPWLWWGMLLGSALWYLLTLDSPAVAGMQGMYMAVLGYLILAVPDGDWLLGKQISAPEGMQGSAGYFRANNPRESLLPGSFWLLTALLLLGMANTPFPPLAWLNFLLPAALLMWAGGRRYYLVSHPPLLMLGQLAVLLLEGPGKLWQLGAGVNLPVTELVQKLHLLLLGFALAYTLLAFYNLRTRAEKGMWIAMAVLAPLLFLALDWRLTPADLHSMQWTWLAILLAAGYGCLSAWQMRGQMGNIINIWLISGTHLGYSLAVALQVREASMTLALAVQLISLAWLIRRFNMPALGWLLKVVTAIVVVRLTLNPWLLSYPTDIHWSLWTYGGSFICCAMAAWLLRGQPFSLVNVFWKGLFWKEQSPSAQASSPEPLAGYPDIGRWLTGASLHLLTLFCWAETRYWLYDGQVYAAEYSFIEACITLSLFAALSLVYHWREQFSAVFAPLYRGYAWLLLTGAVLNYGLILCSTLIGAQWLRQEISTTPIFNMLLLGFGAPVLWAWLSKRYHIAAVRKPAGIMAVAAAFVFINMEIHHLWQQGICLSCNKSDGELYTYSIVWLLLAAAGILGGVWRYGRLAFKGGMVLLAVVIAKLFLVDMAGLEGLWRVASFMGLGLLALGYLHQRLQALQKK